MAADERIKDDRDEAGYRDAPHHQKPGKQSGLLSEIPARSGWPSIPYLLSISMIHVNPR